MEFGRLTAEKERIRLVVQTRLLDTPAEGRFDRVTRITRRMMKVSFSAIALLDGTRCWFKSTSGTVGLRETPKTGSLFTGALRSDDVFQIEDATIEPDYQHSPLVAMAPFVRFFAGRYFCYRGQRIGVLSAMDQSPRRLGVDHQRDLIELAQWVETELESGRLSRAQLELMSEIKRLRKAALVDDLTNTWNRAGIEDIFWRERAHAMRDETDIGLLMIDIDHFKEVNDTHGHGIGDEVLRSVVERMRLSLRPYDSIGRIGGDEFLVVLPDTDGPTAAGVAERIRVAVSIPEEFRGEFLPTVTVSQGVAAATCFPTRAPNLESLKGQADEALYRAKTLRNRVEVAN